MKSSLINKNGSALIGVLIVLVIIVLLFYGGFSLIKKNQSYDVSSKNTIDTYKKAKDDLNKINKTIKTNNKQLENLLKQATSSN